MGTTFNRAEQTRYRQYLRAQASLAEKMLWRALKGRQIRGCKFRRQHGILTYIVDFYCPILALAIEIDGPCHDRRQAADARRQRILESHGVHFLRFSDVDVMEDSARVIAAIEAEVDRLRSEATARDKPSLAS